MRRKKVMSVIVAEVLVSLAGLAYAVDVPFMAWSVVWSVFYTILSFFLKKIVGGELEGYPRSAYYNSVLSQMLILPGLMAGLLWSHRDHFEAWVYGPTNPTLSDPWRTAVFASIAGAMMKDYWVYGNINEWFIIAHHIVSLWACCFCSNATFFLGHIAINGVQAESLSFLYNIKMLRPSTGTKIAHIVGMTLSNFTAAYGCYLYCQLENTVPQEGMICRKASYIVIATGLCCVRFGGIKESVQDLRRGYQPRRAASPKRETKKCE